MRGKFSCILQLSPATFCCDVIRSSIYCSKQRYLVLKQMVTHLPPPCRKEFLNWIHEWRRWWKEHHQHPLVDSKPFPDDICMVEAYMTSHAFTKVDNSQVMPYQTSPILRDKISTEGVQEFVCVVWASVGICVLKPFSDIAAHIELLPLHWSGTSTVSRWPTTFRPCLLPLARLKPASSTNTRVWGISLPSNYIILYNTINKNFKSVLL